jgi:hypothetical protein
MSALTFRETVTAVDLLDDQGFGTSALDFVAEFGLISVATSDFPDNPFVQKAAQIYAGKHYGWGYGNGTGEEIGSGIGRGNGYGDLAVGKDSDCDGDGGSNTFDFSHCRSLQIGHGGSPGNGDGVGFGIGMGYGNGYRDGDGWGGGNCYGHLYGEDYISPWATPLEWEGDEQAEPIPNTKTASSQSELEVLEASASRLLDAFRMPAPYRTQFKQALCEGVPIDPGYILWLSAPGRAKRWRDAVEGFDPSDQSMDSATIRTRARALLVRAEITRTWPRSAITALRRQRSESGDFDLTTFPQLPSDLHPWRDALHAVAMTIRALLYDAFAKPANVSWSGQVCSIVVVGCFRLRFDFEARDIHIDERDASGWKHLPGSSASLLQPLPADVWCQDFALMLRERVRSTLGTSWTKKKMRNACFIWLTEVVKQLAANSKLMEHTRDLLRQAYPISEQIVGNALSCRMDPGRHKYFTSLEYVDTWKNAEIVRTRIAEAPELASVWATAREAEYLRFTDDYGALRSLFQRWQVSPAGWKLLVRHGRQLYLPMIGTSRSAKNMLGALVSYVRLLQQAQCREPVPVPLVKALFARHWFSSDLDLEILPPGLIRGATERYGSAGSPRAKKHFVDHEFVPVLGWIARAKPTFDKNQRRASWNWFFAHYQKWSETERRKRIGRRWATGIDGLRWRDFHVTPIRDSVTLWHEGEQMRMCLNQFEMDCAKGRYIVYAVRATDRARSIAHIGLELRRSGRFELDQVQGFANSPVDLGLRAYAKKLPDLHREQIETKVETQPVMKGY